MKDILIKQLEILDFAVGSPRETLQQAFMNRNISYCPLFEQLRDDVKKYYIQEL